MKYSKKQRHKIYKSALSLFYKEEPFIYGRLGLCRALYESCNFEGDPYFRAKEEFPEFWYFFNDKDFFCWLGYKENRLEVRKTILEFCIEMTR